MSSVEKIRQVHERSVKALELKDSVGVGTAVTKVRLVDGFKCEIEDGDWKLIADMTKNGGGSNEGPNPGVLGRGALGACLTMVYARWAAVAGIPLNALEVEIQADYDARGEMGFPGYSPNYSAVRYTVTVDSDAPDEEVLAMLDEAEARCTYLEVFRDPADISREVRFTARERS